MRYEDARERLRSRPQPLPRGATTALDPVVLARSDSLPEWVRSAPRAVRQAAGLVLLYPDAAGAAHVILTARPSGDLRHAGQVSLPGGAVEPGDDFPIGTALREAAEEVGLDADEAAVEPIAVLDPVEVRVSGFRLFPVLAAAPREPRLVADEREVAAILRVPVRTFLPGAPVEMVEAERDGYRLRYGAYPFGPYRIWGATARVLTQLGALLGPPGDR